MGESREAYLAKFKSKLDEWNAELEKLEAKAKQSHANARLEYERKKAVLRDKRDSLQRRVAALEVASEDAWSQLKEGADEALRHIEEAGRRLNSALK
jgi:hypothetical protein